MSARIIALGLLLAAGGLRAADPAAGSGTKRGATMTTGSVILTLADGAAPRKPGQREGKDMELEFTLRDGQWQKPVWGYAVYFNHAEHQGVVEESQSDGSAVKLRVKMTVNKDFWFPSAPGEAEYQIEIERAGDRFTGRYRGAMEYPGATERVKHALEGRVIGQVFPVWHDPAPGFAPLGPGEHPRLVFRKADLPEIRKRMETPEGQAIMARFQARLDYAGKSEGKLNSYRAAGVGLAYQLTGDRQYADLAKNNVEFLMTFRGASLLQDIHYGPYVLGVAFAYDFCYDGWDPAFRSRVTWWLADWADNLTRGCIGDKTMSGYNPNPWSNHSGIRASGAGLAALAVLGEKVEPPQAAPAAVREEPRPQDPETAAFVARFKRAHPSEPAPPPSPPREFLSPERMVFLAARDVRRHMVFAQGDTGWPLEGQFYKTMTYNAGPGHFVQAYRAAMGCDLLAGWPGAFTLLGEWMEKFDYRQPLGANQTSGMWPTCLSTVPGAWRPALRYLYDRAFGLQGDRTFGIDFAYHAGYVLAGYPFEVEPRNPGEVIPWVVPDLRHGRHIFRKPWKDANDLLAIVHLRSEAYRASYAIERSGNSGDLKIWGLGRQWVDGVSLPVIRMTNRMMGGVTTYFDTVGDDAAVFGARFDDYYWDAVEKGTTVTEEDAKRMGAELVRVPRWGEPFLDHGARVTRHMAVDYSGLSGAPALFAILDRIEGSPVRPGWNLKLAKGAAATVSGNAFVVGEADKLHLKGVFVSPRGVAIRSGLTACALDAAAPGRPSGLAEALRRRAAEMDKPVATAEKQAHREDYLVVFTIQNGPAPEVRVDGEGVQARIVVGRRAIRFDGRRLILTASQEPGEQTQDTKGSRP
jgi:hypothetical protein